MKKYGSRILIVVLTVIVIMGIFLYSFGQEKVKQQRSSKEATGFTIARLVVGTEVENNEPVGVAEKFPSSTEKVYCFLEATNITKDTEVSFVWVHEGNELREITLPLKTGPRWRTHAYKNLAGLKGNWKVEIRDSRRDILKEINFEIQ